jgi:hypothetical protein
MQGLPYALREKKSRSSGASNDKRIGKRGPNRNRGKALTVVRGCRTIELYFQFARKERNAMEAERINQIAAKLGDLRVRGADLRRYL